MTRRVVIVLAAVLLASCSQHIIKPTRTISGGDYLETPPFNAKVIDIQILKSDWEKHDYWSVASHGFKLDLETDNGEYLIVIQPVTDITWVWAQRLMGLQVGKRYRFAPTEQKHPEPLE
jgi:hypothetical protein